jgi:hypothetical protein
MLQLSNVMIYFTNCAKAILKISVGVAKVPTSNSYLTNQIKHIANNY